MKKKDYLYTLILLTIPILLLFIILPNHKLFGNSVDWLNQHVVLADALRQAIKEEGTLFPTYLPHLMGGINIYHFSYYGYLRPDILLGVLFPQVDMIDIIMGYSIFLMMLTGVSCYLFLRNQNYNQTTCFFVSILVLLSSLFFQSHKQIMFVNYLPFLFMMLFSIDRYFIHKRIIPFVLWGCLIVVHSYFYSVGCFIICFIYYLYKSWYDQKLRWRDVIKIISGFGLIILISAIITIPTLLVILQNSKTVATTNFLSLFQVSFDLKGLLYQNYGCGFSYLAWVSLILGLYHKKTRLLSIFCIISMVFPFVSFIFNGFLYARSKILIVFIPFVAYILCDVIVQIKNRELKLNIYSISLMILPIFFIDKTILVIIDFLLCLLVIVSLYYKKSFHFLYIMIPFLIVYQNNPENEFLDKKTYQEVYQLDKRKLVETYQDSIIKISDLENYKQAVNDTFGLTVHKASGYTSTNHSLYNQFLYDTLHLPISINNRVSNQDNSNIFYQGMMSINTILTKDKPLIGYRLVDNYKSHYLYQNQNVMPLGYASSNLYSQEKFKTLAFPQTLDTIYNNVIVDTKTSDYQSKFIKETSDFQDSYYINNKKQQKIIKNITRTSQNQILVIEFDIQNLISNKSVTVTINGIKNKLSASNSPYYNNNTHFTYVLSNDEVISQLEIILSKGNYQISNITCSSLDYDVIKNRSTMVDSLQIKKGKGILDGDIQVSKDGYFVTNIPYSKGYDIYIDDQKVTTEIVNMAFLGCKISSGYHQITITFTPPGYHLGYKMTLLGSGLSIISWLYERRNYERKYKRITSI